jgi:hypothetical protein
MYFILFFLNKDVLSMAHYKQQVIISNDKYQFEENVMLLETSETQTWK